MLTFFKTHFLPVSVVYLKNIFLCEATGIRNRYVFLTRCVCMCVCADFINVLKVFVSELCLNLSTDIILVHYWFTFFPSLYFHCSPSLCARHCNYLLYALIKTGAYFIRNTLVSIHPCTKTSWRFYLSSFGEHLNLTICGLRFLFLANTNWSFAVGALVVKEWLVELQ